MQESTFLGSIRRTLLRTDSGELLRMQHAASERLAFGERVQVDIEAQPVAARAITD
ncbi:TOBE domain-containing protein [Agromyces protaetiae]|uniref:TOBE domain-containing protein n=1 Tax=Agromyces protaetiae TaxID=2509455 RepID=UPI003C7AD18A